MRPSVSRFLPVGAVLLSAVFGCNRKAAAPAGPGAMPPPMVTVSHPIMREVVDYDDFTGRVQAIESVDVRARVGGYLEKIFFTPGDMVEKDQVLFQIDPKPSQATLDQARAQLAQAQAALKERQIEVSRLEQLLKTQSASPIESERATAQRDAAKAMVQAAAATVEQAQLNLDYTRVTAPIAGQISRNYVDVGNLIMAQGQSSMMTMIVAMDPIYAYFDVDEQTVLRIRERIRQGQMKSYKDAKIPVWLGLSTEEGYPHVGRIDFVENRLNPETGTLNVRAVYDNRDGMLSPGLFARIRLQVGAPYQALMVPERALGSDQGLRYVLVVDDKNVVEFRPVKVGRLHEGLRVITQGLSETERIITNGLLRVRPGVTVTPQEQPIPEAASTASHPASAPGGPASQPVRPPATGETRD